MRTSRRGIANRKLWDFARQSNDSNAQEKDQNQYFDSLGASLLRVLSSFTFESRGMSLKSSSQFDNFKISHVGFVK